ncbi:MAG: hypothetical protein IT532_06400 [Burkholderiales bacterium]|nr:hypothetical protein [Burkholderiales bacterium]
MHSQFNEEDPLGAEAGVFLDLDDVGADPEEWGSEPGDLLDAAQQEAWARHAARAAGFATAGADGEDFGSSALTDAVRRVMDMRWD